MQGKEFVPKVRERGYLVVAAIFAVLMATVIAAILFFLYVTRINECIAGWNRELIAAGYYATIPQLSADFSVFNWAISAESAAFSIAAAAQASKKKSNNNFQYAEEWMDKWFSDPDIRPYIVQVINSYFMSNPNNC